VVNPKNGGFWCPGARRMADFGAQGRDRTTDTRIFSEAHSGRSLPPPCPTRHPSYDCPFDPFSPSSRCNAPRSTTPVWSPRCYSRSWSVTPKLLFICLLPARLQNRRKRAARPRRGAARANRSSTKNGSHPCQCSANGGARLPHMGTRFQPARPERVRFGSKADIPIGDRNVRFVPKADLTLLQRRAQIRALLETARALCSNSIA
jgi:hypothetical protein